jgi:superfamily I DNA/RNA helicase/RecB family exonuclease
VSGATPAAAAESVRYRWEAAPDSEHSNAGGIPTPTLDPDQQQVVDHQSGPLLVLAGPGTGKTTTLVEAIATRIDQGVPPEQILALTFGRKAAMELRERVTTRLGRTLAAPICMTFHSFAYALIRRYAPADLYDAPLRLLTSAEQDVQLRELLQDNPESISWPEGLRQALQTRGFADEVNQVLSRARELGLDGAALRQLGAAQDRPELVSAGAFLDQYLDILDQLGSTDYADLIRRAQIEAAAHMEELRATYTHVFVDEYQDTDPGQVALLRQIAGDGRNLVVVGDPHQSIYAFRGAQVRGILDFPAQFPNRDGAPAEVVTLRTTRRFGPNLLDAASRIAKRLPMAGSINARAQADFLAPTARGHRHGEGRVDVLTFDNPRAEAEHLSDLLRRAHLRDGLPWEEMAVLVRSGSEMIPALRRSLLAAGVPVEVASDEVSLAHDPAVGALLAALRAVMDLDEDDPTARGFIDAQRAETLLTGPMVGLDSADLRLLLRALRVREKKQAATEERPPRPSAELLRLVITDPGFMTGISDRQKGFARAARLNPLLTKAADQVRARASVEEVLWTLWSGTSWPKRLKLATSHPGQGARRAHRDLDSMVALFDLAARTEARRDHTGVRNFLEMLEAQQIPSDSLVNREEPVTGVRLMTAHRSKGLEWRLVVVAHVQQDSWPDLRSRGRLLGEVGTDPASAQTTIKELLQEERRLFYVACTRARERLIVTAVNSLDEDGESPSRFLSDLAETEPTHISGRPARPMALSGVIAELRRTAADEQASPPLRDAAARRLARLAAERGTSGPLAPQADPANWWGMGEPTRAAAPLRDDTEPIPMSASALKEIIECPANWFFQREAGGRTASAQQANVGSLIHALAEQVATGSIQAGPDDVDILMKRVDSIWDRMSFQTPWSSAKERARVRRALQRFLDWHHRQGRAVLAVEQRFQTAMVLDDGEQIKVAGTMDRLEQDGSGAMVVIDFKTGKQVISGPWVAADPQLALYQLALTKGAALEEYGVVTAGAEIVQLGLDDERPAVVNSQPALLPGSEQLRELEDELSSAAGFIREERFPATPGEHCSRCEFWSICPAKSSGSVLSQ